MLFQQRPKTSVPSRPAKRASATRIHSSIDRFRTCWPLVEISLKVSCSFWSYIPVLILSFSLIAQTDNGGGGRSFKNAPLDTESFKIGHTSAGILTMVNTGGTIDSKFAITSQPIEWINNNFVVVGHITEGMSVFRAIEDVGSPNGQMSKEVRIVASGQIISSRAP